MRGDWIPWDIDTNSPKEGWVEIPEYPNYLINRDGEIWNKVTGKLVSSIQDGGEAAKVYDADGKRHHRAVRRLLKLAFPEG